MLPPYPAPSRVAAVTTRPEITGLVAGLVALALVALGVRALPALAGSDGLVATPVVRSATAPVTPTPAVARDDSTPAPAKATPTPAKAKKAKKKAKAVKVPATGPGTYDGAGASAKPETSRGTLKRFDVRVEDGLDIEPEQAALLMEEVLNDKRSWRGTGRWRFQLVKAGQAADLHAYIVTPGTTDKLCAPLLTRGEVSCQSGNRVVLNAKRWVKGVSFYGDDVPSYRRYLINHEFGHALGHNHVPCPGSGQLAPVMMQQTKGLDGCRKNPWPLPAND